MTDTRTSTTTPYKLGRAELALETSATLIRHALALLEELVAGACLEAESAAPVAALEASRRSLVDVAASVAESHRLVSEACEEVRNG
ncbi:MAG: hypothetical protein IT384_10435 [Deltaproteobacteria bacterium]|nr:hypothetical protein [Deltaproteobacteria bacterium]